MGCVCIYYYYYFVFEVVKINFAMQWPRGFLWHLFYLKNKKEMKDESLCALVATKQSGLPYSSCKIKI